MTEPRITPLNPEGHYSPVRPYYSQTMRVTAGDLVFLSGSAPLDEEGVLIGEGDIEAQTKAVFANLLVSLEAHGLDFRDLVSLDVFIIDMADYDRVGAIRSEVFPSDGPTGILIGVAAFPIEGMKVAVRGIAAAH